MASPVCNGLNNIQNYDETEVNLLIRYASSIPALASCSTIVMDIVLLRIVFVSLSLYPTLSFLSFFSWNEDKKKMGKKKLGSANFYFILQGPYCQWCWCCGNWNKKDFYIFIGPTKFEFGLLAWEFEWKPLDHGATLFSPPPAPNHPWNPPMSQISPLQPNCPWNQSVKSHLFKLIILEINQISLLQAFLLIECMCVCVCLQKFVLTVLVLCFLMGYVLLSGEIAHKRVHYYIIITW